MSIEESAETRQLNEFEALQAIYCDDLKDLRAKGVWNKWVPLNFSITLTPQQGSIGTQEFFVQVDLHIICNAKYPNGYSVPEIVLENSRGLSALVLQELRQKLEERANELVGEEMILQLAQYVEEFLHEHNKPASKSLYEEMLRGQKEQKERDLQAQEIEFNQQRQRMFEEVQRRQEILKLEAKKRRAYRLDEDRRRKTESSNENSEEFICQHKSTTMVTFGSREILRGRCIKHSSSNHTTFFGISKDTGELVVISEWSVEIKSQKQISSIEQELNYLNTLKHRNLARYYSLKCEINNNSVIVNLLREYVDGPNCFSLFLQQNIKPDIEFLKYIAKEVLSALDYLHRNNVVHKEIENTCVYFTDSGVVKMSNYSIHKRLSDLSYEGHSNYSKNTDIFKFGVFLLSLAEGKPILDDSIEIPNSIQSDLYDLLTRCFAKNESDRFTTSELLSHPFFHKPIVHFSPRHNEIIEVDRNESPDIHQDLQLLSNSVANSQSRLNNEFEFLQHLGEGAFGYVIKVRNKLDGGSYAIKIIKLNPKNKALNKKIVREVKLLSRLNHENVVRYYNSWIETTTIKGDIEEESSSETISTQEKIPRNIKHDELILNDDIEALAPPMKNIEVSITYDSKSQRAFDSSSDDDDDSSDEDETWSSIYHENSESDDGIEFQNDSKSNSEDTPILSSKSISAELTQDKGSSPKNEPVVNQIDFMYIQMEFCEKSTLRTAIDNALYLDSNRMWRLFREIVEGLAHIHQQGMIHRDLKPVNIFLDSNDHVKIGDFGLATTSIKSKQNEYLMTKSAGEWDKEDTFDESKTGLVGTALYVAPEISSAAKVVYNQKVDIYSLGIILFEMCYSPLHTAMERIKILTKLRQKEILFPEDFISTKTEKEQYIIRWLLDHDTSKRPTSQELLQSEYIPPPVLEERELRELVRHTLTNPQLKGYKYLIASCFTQTVTPAQDITYDKDLSAQTNLKALQLYEYVKDTCVKIFKQHCGQNLTTPLLMPKSIFYEGAESCVKLMTHFGGIVSLPYDLRVPFARYVALNGITLLRRYSIERVYREKKVFGFQPRELYECAFDIVTPTPGSLMSDAEILYIVYEILHELPALKNKHLLIKLNHTSLLKGILLHCGIKEKHQEIYKLILDAKEDKMLKPQMQNHFISLGLPDNTINLLMNLLNSDIEISKAVNQFQMITKKKSGDASLLTRQALQDLKIISQNAQAYGVKIDVVVSPGLVYNIEQCSGMICQFVCELKKKHKHNSLEVLAAGGRYDSMISWYRTMMEHASMINRGIKQSAVGISISLDKLVQAMQKEEAEHFPKAEPVDVVVCSVGNNQMIKEKTKILRGLWNVGIKSWLIETDATNIEEIQNELKVPHVIILKDNELGIVRVRTWDRDRFQEKNFTVSELLENIQKIIKNWDGCQENVSMGVISRSESKSSYSERMDNNELFVEILFVTIDKLSSNTKKRFENQIRSQLEGLFKKLTQYVTVIGVLLESKIVRTLASFLEFETESKFQETMEIVIEKHQRHKKYIRNICDEIYEQKSKRTAPTIVLYSTTDNVFKIIV